MTNVIKVKPVNETFIKLEIDDFGIEQELEEFFTFFQPGYKFMPTYKNGMWDGKIRLFNKRTKNLYKGLLDVVLQFAKINNYDIKIDSSLIPKDKTTSFEEFSEFCNSLNVSNGKETISIRDYQVTAAFQAIENYRKILISPTGSGKSLIIYSLIRWFLKDDSEDRILIIVPTTTLVEQLFKDFLEYSTMNGWDTLGNVQLLYSGKDKIFSKKVMISTWQSLLAMKKSNPKEFSHITKSTTVSIFDEAHQYKADAVRSVIESFTNTKRRIGTTGTLDGTKINELVLTGLIGTTYQVKTTRQLIDEGVLSDIKIHVIRLKYPEHICKEMKGADYQTEIDFIIGTQSRNEFIKNLALRCKGTTLITFAYVERHGKVIYDLLKNSDTNKNIYYVSGETGVSEREDIRQLTMNDDNAIIVASEKLFSTGVNIPGITNIILAMPRKAPILIRQTIGRGLRKSEGKQNMNLYDIADDMSVGRRMNNGLRSLNDRLSIYIKEDFEYTTHSITLK